MLPFCMSICVLISVVAWCAGVRFIGDDQGALVSQLGILQDTTEVFGAPRAKVRLLDFPRLICFKAD